MEFRAFREYEDYQYDIVYEFQPKGTSKPFYNTSVTIDWLDLDIEERGKIVRVSCDCQDYERRRHICKHIKECIRLLSEEYKFRIVEDELIRYWCGVCHQHYNTSSEEAKCYKCKMLLLESDTTKTKQSEMSV